MAGNRLDLDQVIADLARILDRLTGRSDRHHMGVFDLLTQFIEGNHVFMRQPRTVRFRLNDKIVGLGFRHSSVPLRPSWLVLVGTRDGRLLLWRESPVATIGALYIL
jgi:hypothetical protein